MQHRTPNQLHSSIYIPALEKAKKVKNTKKEQRSSTTSRKRKKTK